MSDIPSAQTDNEDSSESFTENEIDLLLDFLLANKMEFTQEFLRDRGLPFSGIKSKLRERLKGYLAESSLSTSEILHLLNTIDGWGSQHIYCYRAPNHLVEELRDESSARQRFTTAGLIDLFNNQRISLLPTSPTLSEVQWSTSRLRLVWVEARQWEERIPDEDIVEGDLALRAYRLHVSRGVIAFEIDLISNNAMLLIKQLPRGSKYDQSRDFFMGQLERVIPIRQFDPIRVSRAIRPIEELGLVRRRQLAYSSPSGSKVQFTSAGAGVDVYSDDIIENAAVLLRGDTIGSDANFYWLSNGDLNRELHSRIYGVDQRIAIFGQHKEQAVRHVLSHILQYC